MLEQPWILWLSNYQQWHLSTSIHKCTNKHSVSVFTPLAPMTAFTFESICFMLQSMLVSAVMYTAVCNTQVSLLSRNSMRFNTRLPYVTLHTKTMLPGSARQMDVVRKPLPIPHNF
jgi:hypothetical protein